MNPTQDNNSSSTSISAIDLYARAAATLYGIISFDDFLKILEVYYGEGSLSKEGIMAYFWSAQNDDPIYYTQDELIVHASIFPDEVARTFSEIRNSNFAPTSRHYKILPQKEFLLYADPYYYENTSGTRQMEKYLTSDLGIPQADVEEIVAEMVFVCRSGACPTFIMDALTRRGLPYGRECDFDLIDIGCEMEPGIRRWETFGYTGREVANS